MGRIGKNKDEIIDCAFQLIDKKGLALFQLSDVAQAMEIKTPSLYNHFDGLDDLLRSVQIRTNENLYKFMLKRFSSFESKKFEGKIAFKALCNAYRDFFKAHTGVYEILTIPIKVSDKEMLEATFKPAILVNKIFSEVSMSQDFGVHIMRSVRSALHGFVSLEAANNMVLKTDVDESFEVLVDMLVEGIWSKLTPKKEKSKKTRRAK